MTKGDFLTILFGILLTYIGMIIISALVYPAALKVLLPPASEVTKVLTICIGIFVACFGAYLIYAVVFKKKFWEED